MRLNTQVKRCYFICLLPLCFFKLNVEGKVLDRTTPQRYNLFASQEKKFVWFKVFKVASRTLQDFLSEEVEDLVQSKPEAVPEEFQDFYKFSFVRNPWDRVVSCYFQKVVTKLGRDFGECFDKDFEYFVDYIQRQDLTKANSHIKLQTRLIPVDQMDFIGKLDHFESDLQSVCERIGIPFHPLPHQHKTNHTHYSTYYNPRTQAIIAEKYREDIKAFGFVFENEFD